MSRKTINLTTIEDKPAELPEEVKRIGIEAAEIIWKISQEFAQRDVDVIRQRHNEQEKVITQQRQEALNQVATLEQKLVERQNNIEQLTRAQKALEVDLERETGELKSAQTQIAILKEKVDKQEHEIRNLIEELGRAREHSDSAQKKLYELNRQLEQEHVSLREAQEEAVSNARVKERVEHTLKETKLEADQVWRQLKQEQARTSVAEAQVQELRETLKKYENEQRLLKEEKKELRNDAETEKRNRIELEKKIAALVARSEAQDQAHKDNHIKQDHDLNVARQEAQSLRDRMIKTEGALERERKAVERLEAKLIAAFGEKVTDKK